ncbi:hypothetical protein U1Q18_019901 [Sarracenia purpurea var. burkii]
MCSKSTSMIAILHRLCSAIPAAAAAFLDKIVAKCAKMHNHMLQISSTGKPKSAKKRQNRAAISKKQHSIQPRPATITKIGNSSTKEQHTAPTQ